MGIELNAKIIRSENESISTIFLIKSKNLSKFKSIRAIEESYFLILKTKKVFKFLK